MNIDWIGISPHDIDAHDYFYASDGSAIIYSNSGKPKPLNNCNDKKCFGFVPVQNGQTNTFQFGQWSGQCCTMKKYSGIVCDKKIGK